MEGEDCSGANRPSFADPHFAAQQVEGRDAPGQEDHGNGPECEESFHELASRERLNEERDESEKGVIAEGVSTDQPRIVLRCQAFRVSGSRGCRLVDLGEKAERTVIGGNLVRLHQLNGIPVGRCGQMQRPKMGNSFPVVGHRLEMRIPA